MTLSVALCTYNGDQFLVEQLESILAQSLAVQEIVVCDDGSTDGTMAILAAYQQRFPQLFNIIQNETNLGYTKNFEKALYCCTQDLIIICDQDDIWERDKTFKTVQYLNTHPEKDGVFHDLKLIDGDNIQPSYLEWKSISYQEVMSAVENEKLFPALVTKGSFILGCSLAIKREALEKHFLKDFTTSHDYYIAQKLSLNNKLGFLPEALSQYRLHAGQVYGLRYQSTSKKEEKVLSKTEQYFKDEIYLYLKILERHAEIDTRTDAKTSSFYAQFLEKRATYLQMMPLFKRKIYIAKCIRHHYLDLKISDLIKY